MKEFNLSSRGKTGMMQAVELLDIGLSSCALTIAIPQDDPAKTPFDLNGRVIVTKYPNIVAGWARAKGIEFSKIINGINVSGDITGGIEGYTMFDPSVTVIADIVQSGESLVRYGWKPLGIIEDDWTAIIQDVEANVPKNERRTFINLNDDDLKKMAGVMMLSNVVLVRNTKKLSPAQEDTLNNLTQRFEKAAKALGASPIQQTKAVADQNLRNPEQGRQALPWTQSPPSTAISHGLIFL
jgi:ATP phosphoribosyltransferase